MADTYDMINVAQYELEELVCEYTSGIRKAEQTMVGKDGPQSHGPSMQYRLETKGAEAAVTVYNFNAFS